MLVAWLKARGEKKIVEASCCQENNERFSSSHSERVKKENQRRTRSICKTSMQYVAFAKKTTLFSGSV